MWFHHFKAPKISQLDGFLLVDAIFLPVLALGSCQNAFGGLLQLGVPLWGPHNKDYSIVGSILGFPCFGDNHFSKTARVVEARGFLPGISVSGFGAPEFTHLSDTCCRKCCYQNV